MTEQKQKKPLPVRPKKWVRKRRKKIGVVKWYEFTTNRKKFPKIFENIFILMTFIQPEDFPN